MKAVGFDTCVVLRLLVGEPETQANDAYEFLETSYYNGVTVCVSDLVVAEVYHALCHHYEIPIKHVVRQLSDFLSSPMVTPTGQALSVLSEYKGSGAGFVDRLIRADFLSQANEIVTFDKAFARQPNVKLLKAGG